MLLCFQILTNFIASTCQSTKEKLKEASLDVYEAIVELSATKNDGHNLENIRESLVLLAHALTTRPFYFTAAGFFEIDNSFMFTLVGSISYYVAIFIQFKQFQPELKKSTNNKISREKYILEQEQQVLKYCII